MIRNVVVGTVHESVDPARVEEALQALRDMQVGDVPLQMSAGQDLGMRSGNASYAITVDLPDEQAYRRYDADEAHNRIRREYFAPISADIRRIQFRLPG